MHILIMFLERVLKCEGGSQCCIDLGHLRLGYQIVEWRVLLSKLLIAGVNSNLLDQILDLRILFQMFDIGSLFEL